MDDHQALAVVTALAHGANPQTGEVFGSESVYQTPNVIRALFVAQRALEARLASVHPASSTRPAGLSSEAMSSKAMSPETTSRDTMAPPPHPGSSTERTANKGGASRSSNIGKPWSSEEDARLLKAFHNKQSAEEIARVHGRSASGIRARLEKHGQLIPSNEWPAKQAERR